MNDTRGGAPNDMFPIFVLMKTKTHTLSLVSNELVGIRVFKNRKRGFDDLGNLGLVGTIGRLGGQQSHNWSHRKTGGGGKIVEKSKNFHLPLIQTDLLTRLPKRILDLITIVSFSDSTGKRNLTFMCRHSHGALGDNEMGLAVFFDNRNQNSCRRQIRPFDANAIAPRDQSDLLNNFRHFSLFSHTLYRTKDRIGETS